MSSNPNRHPSVTDKTALKAFWVALIVNLTREFCGCIAVLVYASHIFAEASKDPATSIALSPNKQSILLAAVQIVGSFLACQLVDRVGRKVSIMLSDQLIFSQLWFLFIIKLSLYAASVALHFHQICHNNDISWSWIQSLKYICF